MSGSFTGLKVLLSGVFARNFAQLELQLLDVFPRLSQISAFSKTSYFFWCVFMFKRI